MSQSAYNQAPPINLVIAPTHALSVVPRLLDKMGADKSDDWNAGADYCYLAFETGLKHDGVYPALVLMEKLVTLDKEYKELQVKLEEAKAEATKYRKMLIDNLSIAA